MSCLLMLSKSPLEANRGDLEHCCRDTKYWVAQPAWLQESNQKPTDQVAQAPRVANQQRYCLNIFCLNIVQHILFKHCLSTLDQPKTDQNGPTPRLESRLSRRKLTLDSGFQDGFFPESSFFSMFRTLPNVNAAEHETQYRSLCFQGTP